MGEDVCVVAAGILKGVRQNRHRGDLAGGVHRAGQSRDGRCVPLGPEKGSSSPPPFPPVQLGIPTSAKRDPDNVAQKIRVTRAECRQPAFQK